MPRQNMSPRRKLDGPWTDGFLGPTWPPTTVEQWIRVILFVGLLLGSIAIVAWLAK